MQYRTVGTKPHAVLGGDQGVPDHPAARSAGTRSRNIAPLLALFRERGWPVLYPHVAPKQGFDAGRLAEKVPAIMGIAAKGYEFVAEIAPPEERHAAAEEASERVLRHAAREPPDRPRRRHAGRDRLHHQRLRARHGRRCLRLQLPRVVPQDAVYDRSDVSHAVNLFDMSEKYADVMPTDDILTALKSIKKAT